MKQRCEYRGGRGRRIDVGNMLCCGVCGKIGFDVGIVGKSCFDGGRKSKNR